MRKLLTFFVTSCLLFPALASAGTGDLDPTFGSGGITRLSYAEGRPVDVKGSVKLHDGRIVVVGDIASPDDSLQHVFFARLNDDGTLDTTFGNAGWTIMVAPRPSTSPYTPVTCSAAGVARGSGTITALATCEGRITLFSVSLDGAPNLNFGSWYGSGSRIDEYGANLTARAIAMDSQGRIIVGGSHRTSPTTTSNAFMKRYLSIGVGDQTFGSALGMAGLSTQSLALGDDELLALAVDGTDRIVGVGYGTASLGGARFMLATRFQANGTIGPFGYTNQNFVSYTGEGDTAHAVALENSGAIVVAGTAGYTHWNGQSSSKFYVWRLDANGYTSPEGAVAIDMPIEIAHDANASASAVHITQDGWIAMVGGTVTNSTATRTAYVCVYPNNTVATFCGNQGRYFGPPSLDGGSVSGLYVTSDGKFLSVGRKSNAVAVARFNHSESGVIDEAFGTNGAAIYASWLPSQVAVNGLAVQPDGKLVVAATSQSGAARVGRLDASGQIDTTFGAGGYYDLDIEGNTRSLAAQAAAVQPDGKILVALRSAVLEGFDAGRAIVMVIRLNADGTRDATWISYLVDGKPAAIALKGDGRVVLLTSVTTPSQRMALTQFATDGSIQSSATLIGTGSDGQVAAALALDANGNALAAGYSRMSSSLWMVVYRYTDMLQPDGSWGGSGFSIVDFGVSSAALGVAVAADGKVVLAGACANTVSRACFARLESNGQLDASYGVGGKSMPMTTPSGERAVSAHVTAGGKTFAAIDHMDGLGIALVRADGTLDTAVSGTGSNLPVTGGDAIASVMQADGRVVVAGSDSSPEGAAWILARFEPDVVVPPDTVIDFYSPPYSPTAIRDAMMGFVSSKPGSTYECSLDGSGFTPCTSPAAYTGLSEGTHTFRVRAIDAAGVADPTPAERTWIIDLPPTVAITSGPTGPTNAMPIAFTFASNDPAARFYCRVEGPMGSIGQGDCPSPYLFWGYNGNHTLYVRAFDAGGQPSPEAQFNFTIDTQAPMVTLTGMPPYQSTSDVATFTFVADESAATFECLTEITNFTPCTSPFTRTGLQSGQHLFVVRAKDAAGNMGPDMVYQWTVDVPVVPLETTITSGPSGVINVAAVFTFVANTSPAGFECRVDNSSWFPCASPMNLGIAPPGMHSFTVRAINASGPDPTPAIATWGGAGVPDTTITPSSQVPAPSVNFNFFSTIVGATFECRIDGGTYAPCATPYTLTGPAGGHTLFVRARWGDDVDPTPAQVPFMIAAPPDTVLTQTPPPVTGSTQATFRYSANPNGSFECKLDNGAFVSCPPSGITFSGLPRTTHTFQVRARNNFGVDPTPATYTWRIQ